MKINKANLIRTYVVCKNKSQVEQVKKIYESAGLEFRGNRHKDIDDKLIIGAVSPDLNLVISLETRLRRTLESRGIFREIKYSRLIPSKPRRKFPREMMVSMDGFNFYRRTVVGKVKSSTNFIAIKEPYVVSDPRPEYVGWKYAKEIE